MVEKELESMEMPTLTFGDQAEQPAQETAEEIREKYELKLDVSDEVLNEAEKQAVNQFSQQIDLHNTKGIMEYGSSVQKKMADFSQSTLDNVRTKDLGEVGDLLTSVVSEVKNFDEDTDAKGIKGMFKKSRNRLEIMKAKYDKTEVNINKICNSLEEHQVTLLKDVAVLDKLYDLNMNSFKEVTMYILAGKKKLEDVRNNELVELQKKAAESGKAEDAQAAKDLADQCNRFEKKLYDLQLTRTISMQTAPQIRMLQNTDTQMAEKIQSVIVNTIPLWKNQMVIALGIAHSTEAIKAEQAVTNATNELLKKNAESLHIASVEAAKANERGIVDMETLKHTNATLISTLDDVMKIQKEGREQRANAEVELRNLEKELKQKLLEMSQN